MERNKFGIKFFNLALNIRPTLLSGRYLQANATLSSISIPFSALNETQTLFSHYKVHTII